jgi:DNA adenine methylase
MEGDYLFPYVGSKQKIVNWILWSVTNWEDFLESNEWAKYKKENPEWFEGRFSATVPEWTGFSSLKKRTRLPEHKTFVEVFGGSATVLYNKPPSQEEVYNDHNEDFPHFFETLRDHAQEIMIQLEGKPYDEKLYDKWEDRWYGDESWYEGSDRPVDKVKRAAVFFYLRFPQHHKKDDGSGYRRPGVKRYEPQRYFNKRDRLPESRKRFTRNDPTYFGRRFDLTHQPDLDDPVKIENEDYKEILARYDSPETLFYLDPPYVGTENYYQETSGFDHDELVSRVTGLEGEFILSYGPVLPSGLENYRQEIMDHPTANRFERTIFSYPEEKEGEFHPPATGGSALDW